MKIRKFSAIAWRLTWVAMIAVVTAAPIGYVKVCPLYGPGFYHLPGTDTCFNPKTHDAREETPGGTWRWSIPDSPATFVESPGAACPSGRLVKFGDITGSDLFLNPQLRYQTTTQYRFGFNTGAYVKSVIYSGGLYLIQETTAQLPACPASNRFITDSSDQNCTAGNPPVGGAHYSCEVTCVSGAWQMTGNPYMGADISDLCMFPYNGRGGTPKYGFPLGCANTLQLAGPSATLAYSASTLTPVSEQTTGESPPAVPPFPEIVGAYAIHSKDVNPADIQGKLSVWLCLNK